MAPHSVTPAADDTLQELFSGLYATATAPLPFLAGVVVRSYVLKAHNGPVIIYNSPGIDAAAAEIQALGAPRRLLLNHYHEAMYGQPDLEVSVYIHERDRGGVEESLDITDVFQDRQMIGADLEVIPSFSHTAGTTFYLWDNGEHRFLFPGDALWIEDGTWKAVILDESNRQAFLDTLALMGDLDFDVLVPWHALADDLPYDVVTPEQKRQQIDDLRARIKTGASGARV